MSSSPTRPSVDRLRRASALNEAIVLVSRANQDQSLCERLLDGHRRVLQAYGINNLSSFRTDWFRRDDVIVIAALTPDGERVLAGARMQPGLVANDFPLPQAVGHMDSNVAKFLEARIPEGVMELSALWNSIELAGMGLGSEFLIEVAMAALPMLDCKHLVALTSPVTRADFMNLAVGLRFSHFIATSTRRVTGLRPSNTLGIARPMMTDIAYSVYAVDISSTMLTGVMLSFMS